LNPILAEHRVTKLAEKAKQLDEQYSVLPAPVLAAFNAAARCDRELGRLRTALSRVPPNADASAYLNRLQRTIHVKTNECVAVRASAVRQRDAYHNGIAEQMGLNEKALATAKDNVVAVSKKVISDQDALDQTTRQAYSSMSGQEIGFEKALELHPEIRRSARLWWWAFFAAELLPVLLKSLLFQNNPAAAEAQADLSEEAGRLRIRSWRAALVESSYRAILAHRDVHLAIDDTLVPYVAAAEHLISLNYFFDRLVAEYQREQKIAREYPGIATQVHDAFADAVASALDRLRGYPAAFAPGE